MAHQHTASLRPSVAGFLLLDSSFKPIYFNNEAIHILAYPERPQKMKSIGPYLANKIGPDLRNRRSSNQSPFLNEFMSGKRRYLCWAFSLNPHSKSSFLATIALLIVRRVQKTVEFSQMAEECRLTPREQEAVEFLMQGLTSKEIAVRMKISPNTVKAFFRLVMVKMGVSTRSGIMGKFIKPHIVGDQARSSLVTQNLPDPTPPVGG